MNHIYKIYNKKQKTFIQNPCKLLSEREKVLFQTKKSKSRISANKWQFILKDVQPGFSPANFHSFLVEGWPGQYGSEATRPLVVENGVHGGPIFIASRQATCRDTRSWNEGHFWFGTTSFMFDVCKTTAKTFLNHSIAADLGLILTGCYVFDL